MKLKAIHAAPALLLIIFLLSFGLSLVPDSVTGMDSDPYISASMIQLLLLALPAVIFCRLRGGGYMKKLRLRMFSTNHAAFMLSALLFMFFGSSGISYLMHTLFPEAAAPVSYEDYGGFTGGLYLVLTMAVIPAVTEEFLFRGVILAEYETKGVPAAVFMSSITFAMLHFNFAGLPVYMFCGLVLAIVLYTTRSLFAAMLVHFLNNTATIFFGDMIYKVVSRQGIVLFCFVLVMLILLSAVFMFGECQRIYARYGVLNADSTYAGKRKRGAGTAGLFQSIFTPLFTALAVLYIIIAAI